MGSCALTRGEGGGGCALGGGFDIWRKRERRRRNGEGE